MGKEFVQGELFSPYVEEKVQEEVLPPIVVEVPKEEEKPLAWLASGLRGSTGCGRGPL